MAFTARSAWAEAFAAEAGNLSFNFKASDPGLVIEVGGEPPLHRPVVLALAVPVVLDLVALDPPHREVARVGMGEVEAADRRRRVHGEGLRKSDAGAFLRLQESKSVRFSV